MRMLLFALGALLVAAAPGAAQRRVPDHRFALDVGVVGASLSYANRVGGDWFAGAEVGGGGDFLNVMVLGGRHFSQDGWLAYEEPDATGEENLFELAHLAFFARREAGDRFQADVGVRASAFLHFDASDDDPGGGLFVGPYASLYWGWRHVKLGPRIAAGLFYEDADTRELGINVAPLTVRITFP
ncbi:MAG TPA: hypothetical protein VK399_06815 [Longimicrobiaceae bacterium]|nr:hypothetical protein [Longimicrobiaceae bacterium]